MDSAPLPLGLLQYDQWATARLLEAVCRLSEEQFTQEFAGELSSVRQQSVHLVQVCDRYRARLMGEPVPDRKPESFASPTDIATYASEVRERIERLIATLPLERMPEQVRHDTRRGPFVLTVEQTLMHMANHGTYHRGQIAALLKLHGIEPVDTDILFWFLADSKLGATI